MHHLAKEKICFRQTAIVEAATWGKSEFAEPRLAMFKVEVCTNKREGFRKFLGIVKKMVYAIRLGNSEVSGRELSLSIKALQLPLPVKEVKIRSGLIASSITTEHIFGFPIEAIDFVIHRRGSFGRLDKTLTKQLFREDILGFV